MTMADDMAAEIRDYIARFREKVGYNNGVDYTHIGYLAWLLAEVDRLRGRNAYVEAGSALLAQSDSDDVKRLTAERDRLRAAIDTHINRPLTVDGDRVVCPICGYWSKLGARFAHGPDCGIQELREALRLRGAG